MKWHLEGRLSELQFLSVSLHPYPSFSLSLFALTPLTQFQEPRESIPPSQGLFRRRPYFDAASLGGSDCHLLCNLRNIIVFVASDRLFVHGFDSRIPLARFQLRNANFIQRHDENAPYAFDIPSRCSFRGRALNSGPGGPGPVRVKGH